MVFTTLTRSSSRLDFRGPIVKHTVSAIENLRAALDYGACAVVPATCKKRTSFPFGDTRRDFERHLKSKAKHVPDEIKSVFMRLKPYKRGNMPLWALNKIANTHKHTTIIRPGIDVRDVQFVEPGLNAVLRYSRPKWNGRKNEIVIARTTHDTTSQHDVDLSFGVAFGKVPMFGGMPVLSVLRYLVHRVERILFLTESEARNIGVVK